jgi:hypothetical protein
MFHAVLQQPSAFFIFISIDALWLRLLSDSVFWDRLDSSTRYSPPVGTAAVAW